VIRTSLHEITFSKKQEEFSQNIYNETNKSENRKTVETLQKKLCSKLVGVKFNFEDPPNKEYATLDEPVRFCQAINMVKETSTDLQLTRETLSCKAAKYVLGFETIETMNESFDNLVAEKRFNNREEA